VVLEKMRAMALSRIVVTMMMT